MKLRHMIRVSGALMKLTVDDGLHDLRSSF